MEVSILVRVFLRPLLLSLYIFDGGDDVEVFLPITVVKAEKNPGNTKNKNVQQKQQSSLATDQPRFRGAPSRLGRSENRRGRMGRGSANGNGFHSLDNRQNGAPQSNNGQSNGGKENHHDVNKQYGRNGYGYHQNRQGNGYHKVSRLSDSQEQNNDGGYTHYIRRRGHNSAGNKQQEWHGRGGNRREFHHEINGSRNEDLILEANQSQGQEKLAQLGDSFEGDVPQPGNEEEGWSIVGDRRGSGGRGGHRENGSWRNQINQFSYNSKFGGTNRGKSESSVHKPKESLNGEPRNSDDNSVKIEGEETTEVTKNVEPRQRNHERITKRNQSEEPVKVDMKVYTRNMTLVEYEKQLIEKRKALEALKPQERKVTHDKDFELMQLVGRNKEDFATKLNSEKQIPEDEESIEKFQLKKEERPEQHERVRRSMSMDVFLKVFKRNDRFGYRRDFKRDDLGHNGGFPRNVVKAAPNAARETIIPSKAHKINFEDSEHFPGLNDAAKA